MATDPDRSGALAGDDVEGFDGRRDQFDLPAGVIYLDGNSLGPPARTVAGRVADVVNEQWGRGLISSWNEAGWFDLPGRVGARIARLIGVAPGDVVLADSTSVNLFKTLVASVRMRPQRNVLVLEPTTFPTDGYIATSVAKMLGLELRWCDPADPTAALDDDVAVLALGHVDFRSGAMYDIAAITAAAHDAGALAHWDLCHSVGAVPLTLAHDEVDFAVGCTYKYLNGGPGSPSFIYVRPELQEDIHQPLPGWFGHAAPMAMSLDFEPAPGIRRMLSGTPPVLALSALDAALDVFEGVDLTMLRQQSLSLTDLFIDLVEQRCGTAFTVITPRRHDQRGSQVSLRHAGAYGIVQALIARGVIGDFRAPDVARFGFAPLYVTRADVFAAAEHLVAVLEHGEHLDPAFRVRNTVT